MYAVRKNFQERKGVLRRRVAQRIWIDTTRRTTYFVRGSGPQSLVTWKEGLVHVSSGSETKREVPLGGL